MGPARPMRPTRPTSSAAISRRTLLKAGAGALASATLGPAAAHAAVRAGAGREPGSIELGDLGAAPRTVALPEGVAVVGLQWDGAAAHPSASLRVRLARGAWGPWTPAVAQGHAPDREAGGEQGRGEPLWVGGARELQLRAPGALPGARLRYVRAVGSLPGDGAAEAALARAQPVLAAGPGQPPIIARSAWARGTQLPRRAPGYGRVELAFVHHTDNPNGYSAAQVPAMLRAIYEFHRDVNGWNDIGYNFVVDLYGRVWEARAGGIDEPVLGAQAGGYNLVSTGVAVLGSFSGTPISEPARRALQRLLAWKLALHGVPASGHVVVRCDPAGAAYSKYPANARVRLPRIAGHRDADSTDCPGDALYSELPALRRSVLALSGVPAVASLALQPASTPAAPPTPAAAGEAPAPALPGLLVTLARLDGSPLVGAPVILQARTVARRGELVTHTTLAEGETDAEGRLLVPASFAAGAPKPLWVRALCPGGAGAGAAVSPAVLVEPVALSAPAIAPNG